MNIVDLAVQIKTLQEIFKLSPSNSNAEWLAQQGLPPLPDDASGWFAIPSPYHVRTDQITLALIERNRLLIDPAMPTSSKQMRQHSKTDEALTRINRNQPGNILIIPAQLGKSRPGSSVDGVKRAKLSSEFFLDIFVAGSILLTHPDYLTKKSPGIVCGGTLVAPHGSFLYSAKFVRRDNSVVLDYQANNLSNPELGIATGFEF